MSTETAWPDRSVVSSRLISAGLLVAAGFLGSRVLGLARNVVIGQQFGTSPELDAYFAAFRLPDLLFQLLAGAALTGALLPTWAQERRESEAAANRLASSVLTLVGIGTAAIAGLGFAFAPAFMPLMVPGSAPEIQGLTVHLTRLLLLSAVFFSISGLVSGVLQGHQRFLLPAIAPLLYNGAIIAAAFVPSVGVERLAWGVIVGSALHLLIQLPGLRAAGFVYRWSLGFADAAVRQVLRLTWPRLLGLVVSQLHFVVATILASLLGAGSLAAISFAWIVLMMPIGVFGMALATAFFPTMVAQGAAEERTQLGITTAWSLRLVLFMALPSAVGLLLLNNEVIAALFERGEFTSAATATTAAALAAYAIGLPGHAALEMLTRAFYALRDTTTPFLIAVLGLLINLGVSLALMGQLGVTGLALGASAAAIVEAGIASVVLWRWIGPWRDMGSLYKLVLAAAGMALPLLLIRGLDYPAVLEAILGVIAGAATFLALAWFLRAPELRWFMTWVRSEKPTN